MTKTEYSQNLLLEHGKKNKEALGQWPGDIINDAIVGIFHRKFTEKLKSELMVG